MATVLILTGIAFAFVILYAIFDAAYGRLRPSAPVLPTIRPAMPRPYAGCITCEAASCVSVPAMVRHQTRDHAGGVQW